MSEGNATVTISIHPHYVKADIPMPVFFMDVMVCGPYDQLTLPEVDKFFGVPVACATSEFNFYKYHDPLMGKDQVDFSVFVAVIGFDKLISFVFEPLLGQPFGLLPFLEMLCHSDLDIYVLKEDLLDYFYCLMQENQNQSNVWCCSFSVITELQ